MAELFLSYASCDRDKARLLADRLMLEGYSVWWDRTIPPGRVFDEVIQEALDAAKCVVVLWSAASVRSNWVKTEAAEAAERDRLVPAFIEPVDAPIEFRRIQAADLSRWNGEAQHPELASLLASVRRLVQQPPASSAPRADTAPPVSHRPQHNRRTWLAVAAVAVVLGAVAGGGLLLRSRPDAPPIEAVRSDPGGSPVEAGAPPAPAGGPALPVGTRSPVNLLASENGGELLVASHPSWASTIDGKEESYAWTENGTAVFGFKDGRAATFDTFGVLIPQQADYNLRDFELLVGNASPTGEFQSIGKFSTQNMRMMKQPFQEFRFAPVKARYLKVHSLKNHAGSSSSVLAHEFQLLGRPE